MYEAKMATPPSFVGPRSSYSDPSLARVAEPKGPLLFDIAEWIRENITRILEARDLGGNWDAWVQIELVKYLKELAFWDEYKIHREQRIFPNQTRAVDDQAIDILFNPVAAAMHRRGLMLKCRPVKDPEDHHDNFRTSLGDAMWRCTHAPSDNAVPTEIFCVGITDNLMDREEWTNLNAAGHQVWWATVAIRGKWRTSVLESSDSDRTLTWYCRLRNVVHGLDKREIRP